MEVRPLPQQRHPLMHTPMHHPQQQMVMQHPQPPVLSTLSQPQQQQHQQQQPPPQQLQPSQALQQPQPMQQPHYGMGLRPTPVPGSITPGNAVGPLIGQKRDSAGFPHVLAQSSADLLDSGSITKLFIGCIPRNISEDEVRRLFSDYGNVLEVAMIKEKRPGVQHGICFIKYGSVEEGERAIRALHNKRTLPGGSAPLQVRFADGDRERLGAMEHKLFVGSLSKLATEKDIEEVFSPYGRVDDVYIMRDDQKQSRGCAFVKYPTREMAMAAINALNCVYKMPGCDQPITVRFADPKRPRSGDTRVGGPGFGGPGFSPRSGQGPMGTRPTPLSGGPLGARNPYWRPMGGPGMGLSQGGLRPYGTQNTSRGPHEGLQPVGAPTPSGPSGSMTGPSQVHTAVQGQINSPGMLLQLSQQQGYNQPAVQRPAQAYGQFQQQHQGAQHLLPSNIQQQQSHHQTQLQPLQPPLQTFPPIQASEQRSQQQSPYGQLPSAQISLQPYAQLSASQPQVQQQMTFSGQQAVPTLQAQLPTVHHHAFSYSTQQSPSLQPFQHHQQQVQHPQQLQHQLSQQQPQPQLQQQLLPVQPVSAQLQAVPAHFQQQQQQVQVQQQPAQQQQQSQVQPQQQQSQHTSHQAYFQTALQSTQQQVSVQPSWSVPLQPQVAGSATGITTTTATATAAAPVVTCNWTEHTSPEGHKYYYNSITGESRWEKPEEFAAYEQQQQQQQQQQAPIQQYASSAALTQQPGQGLGYGQLQPGSGLVDSSRTAHQLASAQQALPSVQDWMWKMKPAGS